MLTKRRAEIASCMTINPVSGFTLIEIMTVLVISGILAAISMPYFLSRASAAKQAEGKMLVGTLNRAQQAFYTQNSKFSDTVEALAVGIRSKNFALAVNPDATTNPYAINFATSMMPRVRSYVGMAAVLQDAVGTPSLSAILCEANTPGAAVAPQPTYSVAKIDCAEGTRSLQ